MTRVGRFVTDPRAGAYCQIVLDSGEKILEAIQMAWLDEYRNR